MNAHTQVLAGTASRSPLTATPAPLPETAADPGQAVPAGAPMPHRKVIRSWLQPLSGRSTPVALALVLFDGMLWLGLTAAAVLLPWAWAQMLAGLASGFVIGRLFILGHDACHQSLTDSRRLNHWLGRLTFLPSLTPYSLWEVGHNVVHHGYTNLKGFDFVWAPLTADEYARLGTWARLKDRVYRSGWAPGLYYMVEIWWKRMFFPNRQHMPTRRAVFVWDNLLAASFGLIWAGSLVMAAWSTGQPVSWVLVVGMLIPLMFWFAMIGFVVYVHHTHTSVAWHADRTQWSRSQPFVSTTVHLSFPMRLGAWMHHIMEHTAHHVDMGIPLYRLRQAQAMLEQRLPGRIVIERFSWRWYFDTARRCKLYDLQRQCWTDYAGRATSAAGASGTA